MFCIVSWHREGRDLGFWDGEAWGGSANAMFFQTRKEASAALRTVKESMGHDFRKPNVLDVVVFNEKFGKSIAPKPVAQAQVSIQFDRKSGVLTRA